MKPHADIDSLRTDAEPPEPPAEWARLDSLVPWEDNPRDNDGEAVRKAVASIQRFGWGAPMVARRADRKIIAGDTRRKAGLQLGIVWVPVRFLSLSEAEAYLAALADNRVGEEAKWSAALPERLRHLPIEDTLDAGFTMRDVADMLGEKTEPNFTEVAVVDVGFVLQITGPLSDQLEVVKRLHGALADMPSVQVEALV